MDIKQMSIEQLKALAYDRLKIINQAQEDLKLLQPEIEKKENEPKQENKDK
jgi:hypothetical protein